MLFELLKVIASKYEGIIGYVQGMNFVFSMILYHADKVMSYALCSILIE